MGADGRAGIEQVDPFHFDSVVVGVSHAAISGDCLGVHAARALMCDPRLRPGVAILARGTLGLELLEQIADAGRVLFLDEVYAGVAPGTVVRIAGDDLLQTVSERSVHQAGIVDLMAVSALVSKRNTEVVVLGMRPPKVKRSTSPSRAAKSAVAPLVDAALDQLLAWQPAASAGATARRA